MSARRSSMDGGVDNARNVSSKKMQYSQQELDRRAARQVAAAGRASAEYEAQKKYTESIPQRPDKGGLGMSFKTSKALDKRQDTNIISPTSKGSSVFESDNLSAAKIDMSKQRAKLAREQRARTNTDPKPPKPGTKTSKDVSGEKKVTRKVKKTSLKDRYNK